MSPGKDLPINTDSMVQGLGYISLPSPTDDACSTAGADTSEITGNPGSMASPLAPVSLATKTVDAPGMGARQMSSLHKDGWLNYDKPHVAETPED